MNASHGSFGKKRILKAVALWAVLAVGFVGCPTYISVPNVIGQTQTAAQTAIVNARLSVGTIDRQVSTTVTEGRVIEQSPSAGTQMAPGSSVGLTVSSGPPQATVPNVTGMTQSAAQTFITSAAGLTVGAIVQQDSESVPVGQVISQNPSAGTQVVAGSPVSLTVSSGPPKTPVPNLTGMTQSAAQTAIADAGLTMGTIVPQPSTTVPAEQVISQDPPAETQVTQGSSVSLTVSSGPPQTTVPNVTGMTQSVAQTAIASAGLTVGTIVQQASTTVTVGQVISQNPSAGTQMTPGSSVSLTVSSGPAQAVLNVSPGTQNVGEGAGTTTFAVSNSGAGTMNWTASVTAGTWLRITSGAGGTNSGTITVGFNANTTTAARAGTISVAASGAIGSPLTLNVAQAAPPVLNASPGNQNVGEAAGSTTFAVSNSGAGTMNWTASVTAGTWLRITSGASGTNSGTISVGFDANTTTAARAGTISVAASGAIGSPVTLNVTQAAASGPAPGTEATFAGITFCWCPPGSFLMGAYPYEIGSQSDELPQHQVTLSRGFWMSKYEITQAQWRGVMGSNPSSFPGDGRPVEMVSWTNVQQFIQILNNANPTMNFRLPSEAEWEYACRASTTTRFYWGDDPSYNQIGNYAWYDSNSGNRTHDVGGKIPNAWGLCDMSGNVWEWCQDWWGSYAAGAVSDSQGPSTGSRRVLRGGSWDFNFSYCRSAYRVSNPPDYPDNFMGFRVVRTP